MTQGKCTLCGTTTDIKPLGLVVEKTGNYTPTGRCLPCLAKVESLSKAVA